MVGAQVLVGRSPVAHPVRRRVLALLPTDDGIRFLTRYDYRPRWGWLGETLDRWAFRPLFGWATAWSFDRLRLWLEEGLAPERSRDLAVGHAAAVAGLTGVWLYQGLVPKLWRADEGEIDLWQQSGLSGTWAPRAVRAAGAAEVVFGVVTITRSERRWPFAATAILMPVLVAGAARADRRVLVRAFNPVSLNWAVVALAISALSTSEGRPSGRRPLREAPDRQPEVGDLP